MKLELKTILGETAIVLVAGFALALAANAISPRGLSLGRNYFPAGTNTIAPTKAPVTSTNESSPAEQELSARLREKGLQEIKRDEVEKLLRDPRTAEGLIIFVDARDPDRYQEGHIPGAYQFDPFHPEKEVANVMPVCQAAEKIIVYCTGGECEDADTTAIFLRDAGVPEKKLFVYGGGYTEWNDHHLPLETGARNSGTLLQSK